MTPTGCRRPAATTPVSAQCQGDQPGGDDGGDEAGQERAERPAEQARPPADEGHGGGRERQQIGAHRHRAHDEDGAVLEHAERRDDAGDGHVGEVAGAQADVLGGLVGDLAPDERVAGVDRVSMT